MQNNHTNRKDHIRRLTAVAMFTALAYVVMIMIHFPVQFLTLDVKDAVITLCGLAFGPLSALFIAIVVPLIEFVSVSGTGVYGLIMNIIGSASFSITVSLIYKYKKGFVGAVMGLISGVLLMTGMMLLANLIVTPYYTHMPVQTVAGMIPTLLLPFNLVKSTLNAAIVLMLYKPVSSLLRKTGFLPRSEHSYRLDLRTVIVMVVSVLLVILSLVIVFNVLGGSFRWGIK